VARPRLTYLTDRDKEFIHEQTLRVLAEVGVCYGTPTLTELLADAGATVDAEALTARLPAHSTQAERPFRSSRTPRSEATRLLF
jgi:trimethylamine:corrinoid methyltransferase-like protein